VADTIDVACLVNGEPRRLRVRSDQRLIDVLRHDLRLTGTKEGCGKGECGACTVIMDGQAVDSCLMLAYQADGAVIETIEGLSQGQQLHPLQEAFVAHGASQCGICIPGMIMAAKASLDHAGSPLSLDQVKAVLAGNLCRCTGYSKIFTAVSRVSPSPPPRAASAPEPAAPLYFRPRSLEEALEILTQRSGEVRPIAGGTDILVAAKDGKANPAALFDLTAVPELRGIEERGHELRIGAGMTHTEILESPLVARYSPALPLACAVVGGPQIRNRGTIGGNLAHGSPAGDTIPPLYTADARVEVVSVSDRRDVMISDFFLGPGQTVLAADELIVAIRIPKRAGVRGAFLRLGQRQAQAISKVSVAVAMTFRGGQPEWARVALGAVAPTVIRAPETERALLTGGYEGLKRAMEAVRNEVRPIDDIRSTREYRREMAAVLLERAIRQIVEA
jgi:carbon-monoxide dehydrogenase small subunit/xanthine dehydrogenase small subunit